MASSPASSRGASPEILDPEAKVKGLLAQLDSSDDDEATPKPAKKQAYKAGLPKAHALAESSEDDSDAEIRPRGRLAARMQGKKTSSPIPESSLPETARERLRKSLMGEEDGEKKKGDEPSTQNVPTSTTNQNTEEEEEEEAEEDEDDDVPVARHRIARRNVSADPEDAQPAALREESPGLFVSSPPRPSPSKAQAAAEAKDQDSEDEEFPTLKSDRFKLLVEKKRQERLAREAAEEAKNAERRARQEELAEDDDDDDALDISDDEGGRQLSQKERPAARKAGRKAVEEMNRETQRIQRNQQLAHEAKTRKKISKSAFFERFNYRPGGDLKSVANSSSQPEPETPQTDATMKDVDTAPSSPPTAQKIQQTPDEVITVENGDDLPSVDELALQTPSMLKGKGKAVDKPAASLPAGKPKRQVRVRVPRPTANVVSLDESDDELQVTWTSKDKIRAAFDNAPIKKEQDSHSVQALRALAGLKSPGKDNSRGRRYEKPSITPAELSLSLQQKARQQAKMERDERMAKLKAKGFVVQTAEDKEREMQQVESMLSRAREEDQKLKKQEREEAKKEAKENGTYDPLAWDDSEDEEYQASANEDDGEGEGEDEGESAVELSGSEEEEEENAAMVDDEAENEDVEESAEAEAEAKPENADDEELPAMSMGRRRGRHLAAMLSDDEDVVEATPKPVKQQPQQHMSPAIPATDSPAAPNSVLRSAKKTFIPGLPVEGPAGLGLTQIFAGTMDDSQQMTPGKAPTQSMMPDFDNFPDSNFSAKSDVRTKDSQAEDTQGSTQGVKFNISQSQMRKLDSLLDTQASGQFEPSQDVGFAEYTPMMDRFAEPPTSTVQTVVLDKEQRSQIDSPLVSKGRLRRKLDVIPETKDNDDDDDSSAFMALKAGVEKERRRKLQEEFNKKKSKAKEMVQEQADESEDEYAGLGGVDGEDSDEGSDEEVKAMIDDEGDHEVDESKISAFYAERERQKNEQEVERLYKDITTGALRRKRGNNYDLSDSDDGGEALRRQKQKKFRQQQKALFTDERVKKMAENPGNQAFLRTIQDAGSGDEMDLLMVDEPERGHEDEEAEASQKTPPPGEMAGTVPDSQPRKVLGSQGGGENKRAPAAERRTKGGRRAGDVRETLSSLLEDREGSVIPATQSVLDSDDDDDDARESGSFRSDKENQQGNPRRGRNAIVDRISLKRNSSSTISNSTKLAFGGGGATGGMTTTTSAFKVPSFLRRSSTIASNASASEVSQGGSFADAPVAMGGGGGGSGVGVGGGGFGDEGKVKKGVAGKRSGVVGFGASGGAGQGKSGGARGVMEEKERKRVERRLKGAERRVGAVGGLLGKGRFE